MFCRHGHISIYYLETKYNQQTDKCIGVDIEELFKWMYVVDRFTCSTYCYCWLSSMKCRGYCCRWNGPMCDEWSIIVNSAVQRPSFTMKALLFWLPSKGKYWRSLTFLPAMRILTDVADYRLSALTASLKHIFTLLFLWPRQITQALLFI